MIKFTTWSLVISLSWISALQATKKTDSYAFIYFLISSIHWVAESKESISATLKHMKTALTCFSISTMFLLRSGSPGVSNIVIGLSLMTTWISSMSSVG